VTSVFFHLLAAIVWVGGQAAFAFVVVPSVRKRADPATAGGILREVGRRFATVGFISLAVLLASGVANLGFRGVLPLLGDREFWATPFGTILGAKLAAVAGILGLSIAHSSAASARPAPEGHDAQGAVAARRLRLFGRAGFVLSIVAVALAVLLVRGAP
jgi:putative copper export protein